MSSLRQNVRNAYFCESAETILAEYKARLERNNVGDKECAGYLRELLNEALDELEGK